jgi:aryl-alcohol dehydrogenase-like predicted oxidoreductase
MEYRRLGTSDLTVSAVGFGCGGNARLMVGDDDELRLATLRRALDAGINLFDTAPAYGDGRSERNLGRDLRALGATPLISTKVVLRADDRRDPCSAVLRSVEASVARLGVDRVDVLTLHNRVFVHADGSDYGIGARLDLDDVLGSNGVAVAFERLRRDGVVGVGGFTAFGGDVAAVAALVDSRAFTALNVSLNLVNPSAAVRVPPGFPDPDYAEIAVRAHAAGMGVMAIQVLARGALTGEGPRDGRAAQVAAAARICDSLASVALRYVVGKAPVTMAILGFSEPSHVDDACNALAKGSLPPDVEHTLDTVATEPTAGIRTSSAPVVKGPRAEGK